MTSNRYRKSLAARIRVILANAEHPLSIPEIVERLGGGDDPVTVRNQINWMSRNHIVEHRYALDRTPRENVHHYPKRGSIYDPFVLAILMTGPATSSEIAKALAEDFAGRKLASLQGVSDMRLKALKAEGRVNHDEATPRRWSIVK